MTRTHRGLVASRVHSPGLSVVSELVLVFGGGIRNFLGGVPNTRTHHSSFSRTWWPARLFQRNLEMFGGASKEQFSGRATARPMVPL